MGTGPITLNSFFADIYTLLYSKCVYDMVLDCAKFCPFFVWNNSFVTNFKIVERGCPPTALVLYLIRDWAMLWENQQNLKTLYRLHFSMSLDGTWYPVTKWPMWGLCKLLYFSSDSRLSHAVGKWTKEMDSAITCKLFQLESWNLIWSYMTMRELCVLLNFLHLIRDWALMWENQQNLKTLHRQHFSVNLYET